MSRKADLDRCCNGDDFMSYAQAKVKDGVCNARIRHADGSHVIVTTDLGGAVFTDHGHKSYGTGLRRKVINMFKAIGLGVLIAGFVYANEVLSKGV